jgi:hypothetical protein
MRSIARGHRKVGSRSKIRRRQRQLGLWTKPSKTIASSDHGAVRFAPDEKITMRKYLLSVLAIIAGTIIAAETAELALDANGNTAKILIPNIEDRFTVEE